MKLKIAAFFVAFSLMFTAFVVGSVSTAPPAAAAVGAGDGSFHNRITSSESQIYVIRERGGDWASRGETVGVQGNAALSWYLPEGICAEWGYDGKTFKGPTHVKGIFVGIPLGKDVWARTFRC